MANIVLTQTDSDTLCSITAGSSNWKGTGLTTANGTPLSADATDGGTAGSTEISPALENLGADLIALQFTSGAMGASATWSAGTDVVRINVTTTSANLTLDAIYVVRVNSSCVAQETLGSATGLGLSLNSTGVVSQNVTVSAATSPAATDRIMYLLAFDNSHEHGGDDSVGITPNQNIDTNVDGGGVDELGAVSMTADADVTLTATNENQASLALDAAATVTLTATNENQAAMALDIGGTVTLTASNESQAALTMDVGVTVTMVPTNENQSNLGITTDATLAVAGVADRGGSQTMDAGATWAGDPAVAWGGATTLDAAATVTLTATVLGVQAGAVSMTGEATAAQLSSADRAAVLDIRC